MNAQISEPPDDTQNMSFLAETAIEFASSGINHRIYSYIAQCLAKLNPKAIVVVNAVDFENGFVRTEELITPWQNLDKIASIIGYNPKGKTLKIDHSILDLASGNIKKFEYGIHELTFKSIPRHAARALEIFLNLGDIYGIAFMIEGRMYANAVMLMPKATEIAHIQTIETFVRQASVTLKRIEAEQNEERYRALFEFMSQGAFYQKADGSLIEVNNAALKMLGLSREEFLNLDPLNPGWKPIYENMKPIPPEEFSSRIAFNTGLTVNDRTVGAFNKQTQSYVWLNVNAIPLFEKDSPKPSRVFVTMHDITEQKLKEEEVRKSEEKYKKLFEDDLTGDFFLNADGVIVECNDAFLDIFGYENRQEIIGQHFSVLNHDDSEFERTINRLMEHKFLKNFETTKKHKDGSLIHIIENIVAHFDENNKIDQIKGYIFDITQRKIAEEEIKKKNEDLQLLNAQKDTFFSIIAHDLRSPFNSILGFSELLNDEARDLDIDAIVKYAAVINSSAHHAFELLENLLEWARIQQGRIPFEPQAMLLNSLLNNEVDDLTANASRKNIEIKNLLTQHIVLYADENMLRSIVRNLISNAIKFTPRGGKIEVNGEVAGGQIIISVSDNGTGINRDLKDELFVSETSFTTRGTENEKGTGLGLLLCKEFVNKHGGRIWADSEVGKGSTFYFTLPAHQDNKK